MPEDTGSKKIDEASDSLNTKKFYVLLLFVALIGIIGALMMIVFMVLEDFLTATLWNGIPVDSLTPVFNPVILVICVARRAGCRGDTALFQRRDRHHGRGSHRV